MKKNKKRSGVLENRNLLGVRTLRDFIIYEIQGYSGVTLLVLVKYLYVRSSGVQ